jgi:hypothetical protein
MGGDLRPGRVVLLVVADDAEREGFGASLEREGYDVLLCPGPTGPDYTCVGGREGICPLVADADAVVLDMSLDSEAVMHGTSAEDLLSLYLSSERPVVALGSRRGVEEPGGLVRLRRHPSAERLGDAVRAVLPMAPRPDVRRPMARRTET